jgi:hypothetical protein
MANPQKRKGDDAERDLVHRHQALGVECERTLLSGQAAGREPETDLRLPAGLRAQVKVNGRGDGLVTLYRNLGTQDVLFTRADRHPWLVVLSWDAWTKAVRALATNGTGVTGESVPREAVERAVRDAVRLTYDYTVAAAPPAHVVRLVTARVMVTV